jgi:hypothetical protein
MSWKEITYQLTASSPLLMHNGQLANPLNKFARAMKQISSKRAKTDADHEELAHLEFLGGLYINGNGPCLPASNIQAMIINAARKRKEGKLAEAGIVVDAHTDLEYDGPREPEELWQVEQFRDMAMVRVQRSRIVRTRPIFNEWSATITVSYEDSICNDRQLDDWMQIAGTQVGFGDRRPQYGRFDVERVG